MNSSEIRRLIRKLSRRRHRVMKSFLAFYPHLDPEVRSFVGVELREDLAKLDEEIEALAGKLGA